MVAAARSAGVNLEIATHDACPIQVGAAYGSAACSEFVANALSGIVAADPPYAAVVVVNAGKYPLTSPAAFAPLADGSGEDGRTQGISGYARAVAAAVGEIAAVSPVIFVEPIPQGENGAFPGCLLPSVLMQVNPRCADFSTAFVARNLTPVGDGLRVAVGSEATIYDPTWFLCRDGQGCSMYRDGHPVYRDESHLTVAASKAYAADLERALRRALRTESE